MTVYLFNVGQGDHLLLELPDGTYGLIDFHYDKGINVNEEPPALTFLRQKHTPEKPVVLSFLCLSHPHRDHTKGLPKVLSWITENSIRLDRIWLYPGINDRDARIALKNAIAELDKIRAENRASDIEAAPEGVPNNSQILRLKEDLEDLWTFIEQWRHSPTLIQGISRIDVIDGIEICALAPLTKQTQAANQQILANIFLWRNLGALYFGDRNLVSSIIKLAFGEHQLLFGGDCGLSVWQESLEEFERMHQNGGPCGRDYRASFIKASHHGSGGSSSVDLWEQLIRAEDSASVVGISAGKGQRHPNQDAVTHINTAVCDRGLGSLFTTNVCHICTVRRDVAREEIPSLTRAAKGAVKKATRRALRRHAPDGTTAANDHTNEALKDHQSEGVKRRQSVPKQVGAYIFRFRPNSREVKTSKVVVPCAERRPCLFGYVGKERFPRCAR